MTMHSICREIVKEDALPETLAAYGEAESEFTTENGVLNRRFFQCVQQPHVIWACTEWTSRRAHDVAAQGLMQVREDDRVASAFFRPGLYFELFARPIHDASATWSDAPTAWVVVAEGLVAARHTAGWTDAVASRLDDWSPPAGLLRLTTYGNIELPSHFVAIFEWASEEAFENTRVGDTRTVEEQLLVAAERSDLAAYDQFECRPLPVGSGPASG